MIKLSVIIPIYNEVNMLEEVLFRVQEVDILKEIIIIDDGSQDGTRELLQKIESTSGQYVSQNKKYKFNTDNISIYYQEVNQGKGAALARGFAKARGEIIVVQDADLEYDPEDYHKLIRPIENNKVQVVYGSRFLERPRAFSWHFFGNRMLTKFSNICSGLSLTDMETCYKAGKRELIQSIKIKEKRFGVEPELTAKLAKLGVEVAEVQISYVGRSYTEGKKIGMRDVFRAIWSIVFYNFFA